MQWDDEGLVLGMRGHGESSAILEVMTRLHGRHQGLVRGGRSRAIQALLQPGNSVSVVWRARLEDHLGTFQVEAEDLRTARLLASPAALHGFMTIAAMLRVLPERDPHQALYEEAMVLTERLDDPDIAAQLFIHFERAFLAELGFGLDLSCCAGTGSVDNLIYVSPKTGRAVGAEAGEPYKERLLPLPAFLINGDRGSKPPASEIRAGFMLTGYFLKAWIFEPRTQEMPPERERFVSLVLSGRE